mgnify:CR=1 FL=1
MPTFSSAVTFTRENDLGKLRITGRADHACDISRVNGEFACRVHAARDRQVLNDRMFFGRALDLTKQAEIQSLAGAAVA